MTAAPASRTGPPGDGRRLLRDRAVTGALVAALALAALVAGLPQPPAPAPGATAEPSESASAPPAGPAVYREGVVGRPSSLTPLTARTRADRTLVGLIFSGLVGLGPDNTLVPDLASGWSVDKGGQSWTVRIRPDAVWQDGQPVTAADVLYTVSALKDPAAAGEQAAVWADASAERVDDRTVRFTLSAPVGGFLAALTVPLLPAHLLAEVPLSGLASSSFALRPVGSGPYRLTGIDSTHATLALAGVGSVPSSPTPSALPDASGGAPASGEPPAAATAPAAAAASPAGTAPSPVTASPLPGGPTATPEPTPAPTATPDPAARPVGQIELDFFDTEQALSAAFAAGALDGAAGLTPSATQALASAAGSAVVDYPTTTLAAVLLNLRPSHPELGLASVRKALLGAIDRVSIAATDLGGQARVANALVPPESWAYDASRVAVVPYSSATSAKLLRAAGWTRPSGGSWMAPKAKAPYAIEILTVSADVNPRLAAVAEAVRDDWARFGLKVTVTALDGAALSARLQAGDFTAAVLDIASGIEPDLFPLLDSSQVRASGANRSGYQDPALDKLLDAARRDGTPEQRSAAWGALLAGLSDRLPILPIVWADEQMVSRGLWGEAPRLIARTGDRFWDVLAWRLAASR